MNFSEKLKTLRKQFKFSQEQLAEKIGVSRQAITKWETEGGLPDIENLMAIATLFSVSMDELLSSEKLIRAEAGFAYESVTEYDISRPYHFDIHAPGALEISVTATEDEKLRVRLASHVLQTLEKDYKVQIDEHRNRMDVDIRQTGNTFDTTGKEALYINISVPASYCEKVELSAAAQTLRLTGTGFLFELDGKAGKVVLEDVTGQVALNSGIDMEIRANQLPAALAINQINATSALYIPQDAKYYATVKGKSNKISFSKNGKPAEYQGESDAESRIQLAGMNAELVIDYGL